MKHDRQAIFLDTPNTLRKLPLSPRGRRLRRNRRLAILMYVLCGTVLVMGLAVAFHLDSKGAVSDVRESE